MIYNSRDHVPVSQQRKIPLKRQSLSGMYVFRKEQPIHYESSLERDFIVRTEFFLNVLDIIPQPATIEFFGHNGDAHTYTPDFLVYFRLGNREYPMFPKPLLVEVKPREEWQANWRRWSAKWKATRRYAKEQGWCFRIKDESRIRAPALENIVWLARYKRTEVEEALTDNIIDDLLELGSATIDLLVGRHFSKEHTLEGFQHLWTLVAKRYIDCDISRPLDNSTELWVPTDE